MDRPFHVITYAEGSITPEARQEFEKRLGAAVAWLPYNPVKSAGDRPHVERILVRESPKKKTLRH